MILQLCPFIWAINMDNKILSQVLNQILGQKLFDPLAIWKLPRTDDKCPSNPLHRGGNFHRHEQHNVKEKSVHLHFEHQHLFKYGQLPEIQVKSSVKSLNLNIQA